MRNGCGARVHPRIRGQVLKPWPSPLFDQAGQGCTDFLALSIEALRGAERPPLTDRSAALPWLPRWNRPGHAGFKPCASAALSLG